MRVGNLRLSGIAIVAAFLLSLLFIWAAYSAVAQSFVRAQRVQTTQAATLAVLSLLLDQDRDVRNVVSARDAASMRSYLAARQTFDAQLRQLASDLSGAALATAVSPFADLQDSYRAWLMDVARPLVYAHQPARRAARLQRRGEVLMGRMRLDVASILDAIDSASAQEHGRTQIEVIAFAGIAALIVALLIVLALLLERGRQTLQAERGQFFDTVDDLMCVVNYTGSFVYVNRAWQKTLGYDTRDLTSRQFADLVHPDDRGATAYEMFRLSRNEPVRGFRNRYRAADESYHWLVWNAVPDPSRRLVYVSARDETDHVRTESELAELSYADPLTGLPNRRHFVQQLHRAINAARRHRLTFWVLYLDVDEFKSINDQMGHPAGDEALKGVVANIASKLRESDLFARVGGDEFGVLTPPIALPRDVESMAQKIVDAASSPVEVNGKRMIFTVSLGIAGFPDDGSTASEVLSAADNAMYIAKRSGGRTFARFSAELQESPPSASASTDR